MKKSVKKKREPLWLRFGLIGFVFASIMSFYVIEWNTSTNILIGLGVGIIAGLVGMLLGYYIKDDYRNINSIYESKFNRKFYNFMAVVWFIIWLFFGVVGYFLSKGEDVSVIYICLIIGVIFYVGVYLMGYFLSKYYSKHGNEWKFGNPKRVENFRKIGRRLNILGVVFLVISASSYLFIPDSNYFKLPLIMSGVVAFVLWMYAYNFNHAKVGKVPKN